jgi:hypothetical protein
MRRLLLISVVPLVVACSGPAASTPAPAAVAGGPASAVSAPKTESQPAVGKPEPKVASQATSQPQAASQAKPAADAKPQAPANAPAVPTGPKATIAPPSENHGIALGQPFKSGANGSVVLVTNTTDQVMTFTVKMEYRKGADTVTLTSTVSDLLPKQSRPAFAGGPKLVPSDPDAISVAVESVRSSAPTTPKSEQMKKIQVSQPKPVEGSSNVTVEVTNTDTSKSYNVSLASAYMKGDDMVIHGEGQALMLKPGETRTVTVRPVTPVKPYDRVDVTVKSI